MGLSDLQKQVLEYELGLLSDADLVDWAVAALQSERAFSSDADIIELAGLPTSRPTLCESAFPLLQAAVLRHHPDFSVSSPEAAAHARACLRRQCEKLVAGKLTPYDFCKLVHPIEDLFDFPTWLEDFYSHCDWCEPSSSRADFQHLIEYAEEYLSQHRSAANTNSD